MSAPEAPPVTEIPHTWIPLSDGCRLAARVWHPGGADERPVPAILEYIPYRKRDFTAVRDGTIHRYFAEHGYAAVRVDLRGSGDSEGVLTDEYLAQELEDGREVLRWIAQQPWCDGCVGMFGLSWGGFNGLQIAALNPPELKAVISVASTDDRYADDIHYMGGCLLTDNLSWASTMFAYNSCPPDPAVAGERWREMWLERLEGSGLWLETWLQHQTRDEYWKHASVCEDYAAIRCPVYAVSGWADGYSNTVFRLVENLPGPRKGLIGPWGHKYPHMAEVQPAIDFLGECVRWWDRWLKGIDNGIDAEPALRMWMQDDASPLTVERPGRWVVEEGWPAPDVQPHAWTLAPEGLVPGGDREPGPRLELQSPLSVGLFAGKWYSYAAKTDLPSDQREEDGGALVFDSEPLEEELEVLGAPAVELEVTVNKPVAQVAVRLSDVRPDGKVTRVTYGLLNLTHRDGRHEDPEPVDPDRPLRVRVPMNHVAQRFAAGHRLRVSISTSYWPLAWPAPEPARMLVTSGTSRLELPVRVPKDEDHGLSPFGPPVAADPPPTTLLAPAHREWTVQHNLASNESVLQVVNDDKKYRLDEIDLVVHRRVTERYSYRNYDYATLRAEVVAHRTFERGDWSVSTITRTVLTSTRTHFRVSATLDAYEGDARVFAKTWDELIPRRLL
jgi:hypothetical protein